MRIEINREGRAPTILAAGGEIKTRFFELSLVVFEGLKLTATVLDQLTELNMEGQAY